MSAQDNTEHYFGADDVCAQTRVKLGLMHVSPLGPLESVGDGTSVRVQGTHVSGYVSVEKLVTRDISDSRYNIAYVRQYWINEAPENSLVHVGHTQYGDGFLVWTVTGPGSPYCRWLSLRLTRVSKEGMQLKSNLPAPASHPCGRTQGRNIVAKRQISHHRSKQVRTWLIVDGTTSAEFILPKIFNPVDNAAWSVRQVEWVSPIWGNKITALRLSLIHI